VKSVRKNCYDFGCGRYRNGGDFLRPFPSVVMAHPNTVWLWWRLIAVSNGISIVLAV